MNRFITIYGLPGVGKSTFAHTLAHLRHEDWRPEPTGDIDELRSKFYHAQVTDILAKRFGAFDSAPEAPSIRDSDIITSSLYFSTEINRALPSLVTPELLAQAPVSDTLITIVCSHTDHMSRIVKRNRPSWAFELTSFCTPKARQRALAVHYAHPAKQKFIFET